MKRIAKLIVMVGIVATLVGGALVGRCLSRGQALMASSDQAFDRGDLRRATRDARQAAILYVPVAPHVSQAYARLRAIAVGAEAAGSPQAALFAWRAMRAAALSTRSFGALHDAELKEAETGIQRLTKTKSLGQKSVVSSKLTVWNLMLLLGLALALSGFFIVVWRGVSANARWSWKGARFGAFLTAAGVLVWFLAVYKV